MSQLTLVMSINKVLRAMITAEQLRAARAILQMEQRALAKISGVSVETIKRLERQTGRLRAKNETVLAVKNAFESLHLEFLGDHDGRGAGVRLALPDDKLTLVRKALSQEVAVRMVEWLTAQIKADPKFVEHATELLPQEMPKQLVSLLPPVLQRVLDDPSGLSREIDDQHDKGVSKASSPGKAPAEPQPEGRPDFTVVANEETILRLRAPERARADARLVDSAMLDLVRDPSNLNAPENSEFVHAFIKAIPPEERSTLTNLGGTLSTEGLTRLKNALLVRAFGNARVVLRITESADEKIKEISDGLLLAVPLWSKFRAEIDAGRLRRNDDPTDEIIEAVTNIADVRSRGQDLERILDQIGALARHVPDQSSLPVECWMHLLAPTSLLPTGNAADEVADLLRQYTELAREEPRSEAPPFPFRALRKSSAT
jgi:transcriptional regulator with XRE-family HTH domain